MVHTFALWVVTDKQNGQKMQASELAGVLRAVARHITVTGQMEADLTTIRRGLLGGYGPSRED